MHRIVAFVMVVLVGNLALAQYPPPQEPPPGQPQYQQYPVAQRAPIASPEEINRLERTGHNMKLAGALMIGLGIPLSIAGMVVWAFGSVNCFCVTNPSLFYAGAILTVVATATWIGGIPVYVIGKSDLARAYRMRQGWSLLPTLSPTFGPHGLSGAAGSLTLRF